MNLHDFDLNLLVVFDAIYKEKHLTKAGKRVNLTQSAISHALNRLRGQMDDALFIRHGNQMLPTPCAESLADPIHQVLQITQATLADRGKFDPIHSKRTFQLCLSDYTSFVVLPSLMKWLKQTAPDIKIQVKHLVLEERQPALEEGIVDIALGINQPFGANIHQQLLFHDEEVCIMREDHPHIQDSITIEQYLHTGFVRYQLAEFSEIDEYLRQKGFERNVMLDVQHEVVIPRVVAQTDYIANIASRIANEFLNTLPVKILPLPVDASSIKVYQFWHSRHQHDPAHRWMRKGIKTVCESL